MDAVIKKIYCSLDIETSDFDPLVGEVIELGMVFFEIVVDSQTKKNIFKIISEWQSTFKPVKDVSPKILALTGITQDELEISPAFKEKFDEIQELVKDAVIVGHNINFDIKFLQGFGISFSGKKIDTLDIAQIFLPTANSYNLEALMNLLGVEHRDAHRALADSRAAMIVLEKLLKHYSSFPDALKKQLITLFTTKAGTLLPVEQPETEILHLLNLDLEPLQIIQKRPALEVNFSSEIAAQLKGEKNVISFPLGFDYHSYVYGAVKKSHEKILLVVPTKKNRLSTLAK